MANASGIYGRGLTADSIRNSLLKVDDSYNGNSYWNFMSDYFGNQYKEGARALGESFNDVVNQAYSSKRQQERQANMSGVVGTGKQALLAGLQDTYDQAYQSYKSSLQKGRSELDSSYTQSMTALQEQLNERAKNFADYGEAHYDYLQYLFDNYYGVDLLDEDGNDVNPWNFDAYKRYLAADSFDEKTGEPLSYRLKTRKELYDTNYVEEDGERTYRSFYDENGVLTPAGRAYFDLIENYDLGNRVTSFGEWLHDTNEDLYNFAFDTGSNIFDWSSDGTNAGTFRELTGRTSDDYVYSMAEHMSSMSRGEIQALFTDAYSKIDDVFKGNMKDKAQRAVNNSEQIVDQIEKLATDLGIYEDFEKSMGYSFDTLRTKIKEADRQVKSSGKMAGDWFAVGTSGAGGLETSIIAGSAAVGAGLGSIIPGAGTAAGAAVGGFVGLLTDLFVEGSREVNEQRNRNKDVADKLKEQFKSVVDDMVRYSISLKS